MINSEKMSFNENYRVPGLPRCLSGKEFTCDLEDGGDAMGLTPGLERSPGRERRNSLQYSCLENPMDRGHWQAIQSIGSHRVGQDKHN